MYKIDAHANVCVGLHSPLLQAVPACGYKQRHMCVLLACLQVPMSVSRIVSWSARMRVCATVRGS